MNRLNAMADLRREAGFDPHPDYIESIDLCLWLLAKVHDPAARRTCAAQFRQLLATSQLGGCQ